MDLGSSASTDPRPDGDRWRAVPYTRRGPMVAAGVLLVIPIVALMWVPSYAKDGPRLFGFPFFFWYQFLWVFLCSAMTYTAYRLTLYARRDQPRAGTADPAGGLEEERP